MAETTYGTDEPHANNASHGDQGKFRFAVNPEKLPVESDDREFHRSHTGYIKQVGNP